MAFSQPLFRSIDSAFGSTITRSFADRAVMAVFAFLVPLLTMEINYFRLAAFRNWFERGQMRRRRQVSSGVGVDGRHHGGDGDSPSKEALALSYGAVRRASLCTVAFWTALYLAAHDQLDFVHRQRQDSAVGE
jgi:hypothetical protein